MTSLAAAVFVVSQTQVLPALTQVVLDAEAAVNHLLRLNLSHSSISSLLRPQPVQSGPARSLTTDRTAWTDWTQ